MRNYQNAVDKVQYNKMIEVHRQIRRIGILEKDLHHLLNLYWHQIASINVEGDYSKDINIRRGVTLDMNRYKYSRFSSSST